MKYVLLLILGALVGILIYIQFQPVPDNSSLIAQHKAEKREYQSNAQRMTFEILRQKDVIDSLEIFTERIDTQIVDLQAGVDSSIAKDSSNAIKEYRAGLTLLDINPELTPILSLREIGHGALIFRETYGLRLKVNSCLNMISEQDNLIGKQDKLINTKDNIAVLDSLTIYGLEQTIKDVKPRWYQQPMFIASYIILSFVLGLMVAL